MAMVPDSQMSGPIGCVFGESSVILSQYHRGAGGHGIVRVVRASLDGSRPGAEPAHKAMSGLVRIAMGSGMFHGDQAVICMPQHETRYWGADYTSAGEHFDEKIVHARVAHELDVPAESLCVASYPVLNSQTHRIAVISRRDGVTGYAQVIRESGLQPIGMDTSAGAIARCLRESPGRGPIMAIELAPGATACTLCFGGKPVFVCSSRSECGMDSAPQDPQQVEHDDEPHRAWPKAEPDLEPDEIATRLTSFLQYVGNQHGNALIPTHGVVVAHGNSSEISTVLEQRVGVHMLPIEELLREEIVHGLKNLPEDVSVGDAVVPFGLTGYTAAWEGRVAA